MFQVLLKQYLSCNKWIQHLQISLERIALCHSKFFANPLLRVLKLKAEINDNKIINEFYQPLWTLAKSEALYFVPNNSSTPLPVLAWSKVLFLKNCIVLRQIGYYSCQFQLLPLTNYLILYNRTPTNLEMENPWKFKRFNQSPCYNLIT